MTQLPQITNFRTLDVVNNERWTDRLPPIAPYVALFTAVVVGAVGIYGVLLDGDGKWFGKWIMLGAIGMILVIACIVAFVQSRGGFMWNVKRNRNRPAFPVIFKTDKDDK